jgi:uncharacterized protein YecE (DUF72 family)
MIRIGISGWTYAPWRGVFFPEGLAHRRELEFASRNFRSIEINGTFYSLQSPDSFRRWYAETPPDFVFSVKCPRFITHMKRLRDFERTVPNFLASGVLELREKLGPFLWQFPPNFHLDLDRFAAFFRALPRTTSEAAEAAKHHDPWMKGRVSTGAHVDRPIRHAVEIRHASFMVPEFFVLLREQDVAFVFADTAGIWPYSEDVTSDFLYLRLHGSEQLYASGYTDSALDWWAKRIRRWAAGKEPTDAKRVIRNARAADGERDVYVYFDNDVKVRAPFDARALAERLDAGVVPPAPEDFTGKRKSKRVEEEPRAKAPATRLNSSAAKTSRRASLTSPPRGRARPPSVAARSGR